MYGRDGQTNKCLPRLPPVRSRNTPRHVTSSLCPEAMRYDVEGFVIPTEHAKKARRREMRERRDATTVQPAMKKRRKFTTGTRTSAKRMSAPRRYELFVFRVHENATADDIKDYINCDTMAVIDVDCMSNENNYTKSYRVVVEGRELETLYDPEFWPMAYAAEGLGIKPNVLFIRGWGHYVQKRD